MLQRDDAALFCDAGWILAQRLALVFFCIDGIKGPNSKLGCRIIVRKVDKSSAFPG